MRSVTVPHEPASASVVRRELRSDLRAHGLPEHLVDAAALVLSELIGNAVRHGLALPSGQLLARWDCTAGSLRIEVVDGGTGPVGRVPPASDEAEGGRGLALVDLLSDQWGSAPADPGTAVWADLPAGTASCRALSTGADAPA